MVLHRAQQHSGKPAAAMATDDDQFGGSGLFEQLLGRSIVHEHPMNDDVGKALLPAGPVSPPGVPGICF